MAEFIPFRALRFDETIAGRLADLICPPYDIISEPDRERLYASSPHNLVRVEFAREAPDKYARAAETLRDWTASGALRPDPSPAFYLHEHEFEVAGRRALRRGILGALRLYEQSEGVVLPHELTFPKAKADRLELLRATRANTSPVFGMFADDAGLMRSLAEAPRSPAGEAVVGAERHRLERIDDRPTLARIAAALRDRRVYLADGHHRYETALNYLRERGDVAPQAPERYTLGYLCALDDPGLRIFATHRVVRGAAAALDAAIARSFDAVEIDRGALGDVQPGIAAVRGGRFRALELRPDVDLSSLPAVWRTLPVAIAEELLVRPARDAGAEIVYEHDTERAIAESSSATAILLRAVDPATLRRVADAGERMPQKTTYFYPKVPAGLVVRSLDA
ncbi:MAG TPA: DUF1015 domain-containing protein [Candidatus Limnocylindria bacterium]|nr:DUF1015 domain-containing protein [Candidatus Limnocylindria bacterium]